MTAELRDEGGEPALREIENTLEIIAAREDGGYVTEAMVEHRLRLLGLRGDLLGASPSGDRGVPMRRAPSLRTPVVEGGSLRVRVELSAHGEATEIVRGHAKRLRPSFRLGMEIENVTAATVTVEAPTLEAREGFPVSRWYLVGGDGRAWDGVVEAGETKVVNVIGYLGEPVQPGAKLDPTVRFESLVLHASTRARRHWSREEL
jgi:hypothetical protein